MYNAINCVLLLIDYGEQIHSSVAKRKILGNVTFIGKKLINDDNYNV